MDLQTLEATVGQLQKTENFVWVLVCAALVFSMQFGFMFLESGLSQAKHSINVAVKNLADFVLAVIIFWAVGFGLMFGASASGVVGTDGFFLGMDSSLLTDPVMMWAAAFFFFQAVFVGTSATIDSGAVAGRTKFSCYLVMSVLISGLIYPLLGHWVWGGLLTGQPGWLEALGFKDFAGSTVVHSVGGWMALVGIMVVGPRRGKFDEKGNPKRIPPYSLPDAILGTLILFFGWFGFNCGSTLEATPLIAPIAFNTVLAACFGAVAAGGLSRMHNKQGIFEVEMIANGLLGGLVAITAGCAFVTSLSAMVIGIMAGVVVFYGTRFIEHGLKLDDVVGAVPVHGMCGAWGTLAVGLFDVEGGLFHGGDTALLQAQVLGVAVCFTWTLTVGYVLMKLVDSLFGGMRVDPEHEDIGLNIAEHGAKMSWFDTMTTMDDVIRTGDFSQRVEVEQETEAGDVAMAFNRLMDWIQEIIDLADQVAEGRLNCSISPRSERDRLGAALDKMVAGLCAQEADLQTTIERIRVMTETGDLSMRLEIGQDDKLGPLKAAVNDFFDLLEARARKLDNIAQGDLNQEFTPRSEDDALGVAASRMVGNLRGMINHIGEAGDEIGRAVETLRESSDSLVDDNDALAAVLGEVAASVNVTVEAVTDVAGRTENGAQATNEVEERMRDLVNVLATLTELVENLEGDMKGIVKRPT